ncbi:hypothetical protein FB385_0286 [Paramicrobacterium agarici]|nr:hypothetical protein FB385_0286 [Microbacterium agarici]
MAYSSLPEPRDNFSRLISGSQNGSLRACPCRAFAVLELRTRGAQQAAQGERSNRLCRGSPWTRTGAVTRACRRPRREAAHTPLAA